MPVEVEPVECVVEGYRIDLSRLEEEARRRGARRVALQLPDGVKPLARRIADCISEKLGLEVVIHGDSVFGACDLQWEKVSRLGVDLVLHLGHTPYPPSLGDGGGPPDTYVFEPLEAVVDVEPGLVARAAGLLRSRGASRVAVVSSVQYHKLLPRVASLLAGHGLEAVVPRGRPPFFLDGQVLGCDYSVALSSRADAFLFVGGGLFHPLGLYLASRRPVVRLDPQRGSVDDLTGEGERVIRVRLFKVSQAMGARRWGIILGLKSGQRRPWLARALEAAMKRRGVEYRVLAGELTGLDFLRSVDEPWFEAFVVTSCPRIPVDDLWDYEKPVLTPGEAFMALEGRLEPYRFPW